MVQHVGTDANIIPLFLFSLSNSEPLSVPISSLKLIYQYPVVVTCVNALTQKYNIQFVCQRFFMSQIVMNKIAQLR